MKVYGGWRYDIAPRILYLRTRRRKLDTSRSGRFSGGQRSIFPLCMDPRTCIEMVVKKEALWKPGTESRLSQGPTHKPVTEEYFLLRYNAVWSIESQPMFRRNI
jgi:hypothetical protein